MKNDINWNTTSIIGVISGSRIDDVAAFLERTSTLLKMGWLPWKTDPGKRHFSRQTQSEVNKQQALPSHSAGREIPSRTGKLFRHRQFAHQVVTDRAHFKHVASQTVLEDGVSSHRRNRNRQSFQSRKQRGCNPVCQFAWFGRDC